MGPVHIYLIYTLYIPLFNKIYAYILSQLQSKRFATLLPRSARLLWTLDGIYHIRVYKSFIYLPVF